MYSIAYSCSGAEVYALYSANRCTTMSRVHMLTPSRARRLLDRHAIKIVLDVRTDTEWAGGHYTNAKHIPCQSLSEVSLKRFDIKKDEPVLVYCTTGHRAKQAAETLKSFGVKNVFYITSSYESIEQNPSLESSSVKCASPLTLVATA
jgi:phage shock protein E